MGKDPTWLRERAEVPPPHETVQVDHVPQAFHEQAIGVGVGVGVGTGDAITKNVIQSGVIEGVSYGKFEYYKRSSLKEMGMKFRTRPREWSPLLFSYVKGMSMITSAIDLNHVLPRSTSTALRASRPS